MSRETLANDIWRACDIMRRDDGTTGIMEYMEQLSWLLFLKVFESIENDYENQALLFNRDYVRVISGPYRWSVWTGSARKRAEAKVAAARQTVSKAKGQFERLKQRLADLEAGRDPDAPKNKQAGSFQPTPTQLAEAEQAIAEAQTVLKEAQADLQAAEVGLTETIETLRRRVKVLYDEEAVQQQVLAVIDRQFGGRLDLMGEQLDVLRQAEEQRGRALAEALVEGLTGEAMLDFVDSQLFPHLRRLRGTPEKNIISSIFSEIPGNRMRSPHNLKDVINLIDEIDFHDQVDTQVVSQIYDDLLARLGTEGGIAGEFYTPRPIIRSMVQVIKARDYNLTGYNPYPREEDYSSYLEPTTVNESSIHYSPTIVKKSLDLTRLLHQLTGSVSHPITPQKLWRLSGLNDIETFYAYLGTELAAGRITEQRKNYEVYLGLEDED